MRRSQNQMYGQINLQNLIVIINITNYMRENFKTEISETFTKRQETYSLQQLGQSSIFLEDQKMSFKQSIFLRNSYNQVQVPYSHTLILPKPDYYIQKEENNLIISGKTYLTKAMEHRYLKISCLNIVGPLRCFIQCSSEFQVLISQVHPFPTNHNCEQVINNRGFQMSVTTGEFIYISFISRKDSEVTFNIQSKIQKEENYRLKTLQDNPTNDNLHSANSRSFQYIINTNKEQARIKKNKYYDEISRSDRFLKVLSTRNFQKYSQNQAIVQKKFDIKAKQLSNQEKILQRKLNLVLRQKFFFEHQWAILLQIIKMGQMIANIYYHKKRVIKKYRLAAFKIKFILIFLRKQLAETKGLTLNTRITVDAIIALKMRAKIVGKLVRIKQGQFLLPYFRQRAIIYDMKVRMLEKANKILIIKKYVLLFEANYFQYKKEMITKWEKTNEKIREQEIKEKQPVQRNKAIVMWFQVMKDKDFAQQMRNCFIFELMRDRIRIHLQDQQIIKKFKFDLKYYKQKLRICRDPSEAISYRQEIHHITNEIYAMHMKNQLFMHVDVEKYFQRLVSKYIVLVDETENLPQEIQTSQRHKQRQSRISLRKGMRKSKI
ncbi:unnamed protein product (macronuclear) [Paramecium tetraurelia]|uniref:Uncharacterized protein n=1 Tax=Paramecium tetraurelia TaxID=5888 RepID=A0BWT2_PARTE|nr:uncharacterized protein GSPATT00032851001 [Paramecium tetraurelia]CAK62999.1 unnamed protein product [Paramecium tetraurelia]|eukprot:XP_001430397.1 hypothetical protein (macronuclear) [Paramecium tetraurelia strain d4-2]